MDLEIKGFIETSFLDWDGKLVSTLFVPGCNFRCPFCHNSGLIERPQDYESIPFSRIEKFLVERRDFVDGICLTGGEPALHKGRGLLEFLRRVKKLGFLIKFDTNGSDPELLKKLLNDKLVDYVAMDIKAPLDERYHKLAGVKVDLDRIRQSIKIIMLGHVPYEFRVTVVPTLLDTGEVKEIARTLSGARRLVLQQFSASNAWDEAFRSIEPYPRQKLEEMVAASKKFVPNTSLRGA
jgi:pyruvate formate lyase activating enzyme